MNLSNIANTNIINVYEMINNLPPKVYGKMQEAISHCESNDVDFKMLAEDIENVCTHAEIQMLTDETGCNYWSDRLGIQLAIINDIDDAEEWASKMGITLVSGSLADKTLQIHKEQLLTQNGFNTHYTWAWLAKKIDDYVGDGNYTLNLDIQTFTLSVETPDASATWANQVTWLIDKTLPCNIAYTLYLRSDNHTFMNLVSKYSNTFYQYYLNYWALGGRPFSAAQPFPEYLETLNIPDTGWENIAQSFGDVIASAKWNDTYDMNIVEVRYNPASKSIEIFSEIDYAVGREAVEKVALYDSSHAELAYANVFIPYSNTHDTVQIIYNIAVGIV